MDPRNADQRAQPEDSGRDESEAIDFVRFCYRRRRVGWPDLYDEMCAVVGRGLYRGYGSDELSQLGIGLSLFELPALAALVHQVVAEDQARRRMAIEVTRVETTGAGPGPAAESSVAVPGGSPSPEAIPAPAPVVSPRVVPDPEPADRRPALVAIAAGA
jgi:hypothetical protein